MCCLKLELMVSRPTSLGLEMSGNWLSNAALLPGELTPPPSRSSSASSKSSTLANWFASSPRTAFSRSRKLLAEGVSDASLISVWAARKVRRNPWMSAIKWECSAQLTTSVKILQRGESVSHGKSQDVICVCNGKFGSGKSWRAACTDAW
jgi:hypothetical protein